MKIALALLLWGVLCSPASAQTAEMDAYLRGVYPATEPGAAVLVVRDGRTVHRAAYGLADMASGRALMPDDLFHIASITKPLTAAAVLQLAEAGILTLDDPVASHLADVPAAWAGVTLRQLLSHTSGVPDFTETEGVTPPGAGYVHHDTILARMASVPVLGAPGEVWAYSNTGYLLLGRIVERHRAMPWERAMETHLFRPLGMRRTAYAGAPHPGLVPGHTSRGGRTVAATTPNAIPYAAGATVSTVDDLARWVAALDSGRILGVAARAESVRRIRMNDGATASYGLGWAVSTFGPREEVVWHGGDITGYSSMILRIPEARLVVIVLSNHDGGAGRPFFVAQRLAELALGEDWSPRAQVTAAELAPLAGTYRGADGGRYVVEARGARLFALAGDDPEWMALDAYSAADFVGGPGVRFRFASPAGRLVIHPTMGQDRVLERVR